MQNEKNDETNDKFLLPLLPFFLFLIYHWTTLIIHYILVLKLNIKFTYKMLIKKFMESYSILDRLFIEQNIENHLKDKEVCMNEKNTTHKQEFTLQENLLSDLQTLEYI
ncbi:hypothetical protein M153_1410006672 [Pseudoloma neurophilia]|uniref:Uncharacterized protein n=1 Tax=Pseudoloma neurophilia TaxID=146866 RepID=A0A0R0M5W4_9MICR|nr:hypothetical protein M153_1410006672 [Pseudoloma neurophilia]